jgi:hypothetical protein
MNAGGEDDSLYWGSLICIFVNKNHSDPDHESTASIDKVYFPVYNVFSFFLSCDVTGKEG